MRFLALLMAASLLATATVTVADRHHDATDASRDARHELEGEFIDNVTEANLTEFERMVAQVSDKYEVDEDGFEVANLTARQCLSLWERAAGLSYVEPGSLEGCGRDDDEDESDEDDHHDHNETEDDEDDRREHDRYGYAFGHDEQWKRCHQAAETDEERKECRDEAVDRAEERREAYREARENGRFGGDYQVNQTRKGQQVVTSDGVTLTFDHQIIRPDRENPLVQRSVDIRIELDADLDDGRTFVFDVSPGQLRGHSDVELTYLTVHDDGTETEEPITLADSLADIMDPNDDDGPEYWIVKDLDGIHVMVSINAWSVHAVEMNGVGGPSASIPVPGPVALLGGLLVAALLVKRRLQ